MPMIPSVFQRGSPMFTENAEFMRRAWDSLTGRWTNPLIATLIYVLITAACGTVHPLGGIAGLVIGGPLLLGYALFMIERLSATGDVRLEVLFHGFNHFVNSMIAYLLMTLYILLWCLLLIVPGIMAAYSYSMTFYILAENPDLDGQEALRRSKAMMYGHRMRLCYMDCRFFGWYLLCVVTIGVASLWVSPYVMTAKYMFYRELADQQPPDASTRQGGFYVEPPHAGDVPFQP